MQIIDKNTDFYDYLQGIYRDDSITFSSSVPSVKINVRSDIYGIDRSFA